MTPGDPTALRPRWRSVRVAALGGASLLLASTAHLLGGGSLPSAGAMMVTALLLGLIGTVLTGRRGRFPLIMVVLGAEQLALHFFFAAASSSPCGPGTLAAAAHHASAQAACHPTAATTEPMIMVGSTSWSMVITHLLATAATAWLLTRGETWLWAHARRVVAIATAAPSTRFRSTRPTLIVTVVPLAYALPRAPRSSRGPPHL